MFGLTLTPLIRFSSRLFKDRIEALIFLAGFFVEMSFGLYLVGEYGVTYIRLGDNLAHLYIARAVAEGGGIGQLGTVWLPFFHILLVPFVSIDLLYTTGLAGTIVNSIMTGGISALIYRLAGGRLKGVVGSALFLINVNVLIYGVMQFMDPTGVFFMLLAVYHFKRYLETEDLIPYIYCSLALILGTLTRYEVWPVAFFIALIFVIKEMRKRAYRLAYAHFPFWGIFAWLFYNLAIFRNPLIWFYWPLWKTSSVPYYVDVVNMILIPSFSSLVNFGFPSIIRLSGFSWILLPISIVILLKSRDLRNLYVVLLLMLPLVVILSIRVISWSRLYCSLPGIILAPLLMVQSNKKIMKIVVMISLVFTYGLIIPQQYYFNSPLDARGYTSLKEETIPIKKVLNEGSYILASAEWALSIGRTLSVLYGIPQSKIINEYDETLFGKASRKPWQICDYVILEKQSSSDTSGLKGRSDYYGGHFEYFYYCDPEWQSEFLTHYELVFETERYLVYKLLDTG